MITATFVIVAGAIVVLSLIGLAMTVFEDHEPSPPERMSARWLARFNEAEHEDEEARP